MSSILFDPATSSGHSAGSHNTSRSAANAAAGLSFDSFLAKNQSRYEASTALRSERADNDRGYDNDRDYKSSRTDERDTKVDSSSRTEDTGDDYSHWDDEEDLSADAPEREAGISETEDEHPEASAAQSNNEAAQTEESSDARPGTQETDAVSAADATADPAATAAAAASTNASAGAASSAAAAGNNPASAQASQAAGNTAAAAQQAANANAANQNQAGKGSSEKNTATTTSVSNNALVSQSNTALTSGSAVITLQSVDPKTGAPAGQIAAGDAAVTAQMDGKPEAAAEPKPANAAAQAAKAQQAGNPAAQANAGQAAPNAAVNPAAAQSVQTAPTAPSAAPLDALANVSAPQAATSTGTPAFTSLTPVGGVTQTANATGAGAAASGNASAGAATPTDQVAVEIRKGVAAGKDSITIKLNPAELGKIDVKMEISDDGTLRATIAVEKSETLDMLQKDARGLERALQNAGLQADSGSLNFSLRGEGNNNANEFDTASNAGSGDGGDDTASGDPVTGNEANGRSSHDGALDISV
ncbi:flagellar hook-length control protein FliK [Denitrobaculum tricleocarpae]|uniref:Flagellar hook-length control protein FliK n=1 Tax=Denitrobaculum tricleocarpae TaxID=2591009 RepID=A0A545T3T6_9PROT|nr:flagellar hook-length control protein FliK [Denitrobaculum tricleocarpae]TQV71881.1 flagellar hook-length control protein FliK [Denitrobaculum tricleocarpae]